MSRAFELLLWNLRAQGVQVGTNEWLAFMEGMKAGLVRDLEGVYDLGRAVLVHSEKDYDAFDQAFSACFDGVELEPGLKEALAEWLENPESFAEGREAGQHEFDSEEELWEAFLETLREQEGRHDGGDRWVGTGGTSPFGHSGQANTGVRVGGEGGGGRSAIRIAGERRWRGYRTDVQLDVRDFKVALKALRRLHRIGAWELDIDKTIDRTAKNAGDIELAWERERKNRVHVVLLMDTGGSMSPHERLVSRLFTAATEMKTFKSFTAWHFHNCVYGWLYKDYATWDRKRFDEVLAELTPQHRLIFVGDAAMAPWELFTSSMGFGERGPSGLERLQILQRRCPASIWLNPDPKRFWDHPTVRAIGETFPMHPLTLDGLRDGIRHLRAPR